MPEAANTPVTRRDVRARGPSARRLRTGEPGRQLSDARFAGRNSQSNDPWSQHVTGLQVPRCMPALVVPTTPASTREGVCRTAARVAHRDL